MISRIAMYPLFFIVLVQAGMFVGSFFEVVIEDKSDFIEDKWISCVKCRGWLCGLFLMIAQFALIVLIIGQNKMGRHIIGDLIGGFFAVLFLQTNKNVDYFRAWIIF